jgi:hypothetical protein
MKRILIFAPMLALSLLPCQAGTVAGDLLTIYNSSVQTPANIVDQIGFDLDGNPLTTIGFPLGSLGAGCGADNVGIEDPCTFYYINDPNLADLNQDYILSANPTPIFYTLYDGAFLSDVVMVADGYLGFFSAGGATPAGATILGGPVIGANCSDGTAATCQESLAAVNVSALLARTIQVCELGNDCETEPYQVGYTAAFTSSDFTVPEPGTLALLGIGLAVFGLRKRIRA